MISARQVQTQMDALQSKMDDLQHSLEEKFRALRSRVNLMAQEEYNASGTRSNIDRPVSRASRRSRIMEAQAFASQQYENKD